MTGAQDMLALAPWKPKNAEISRCGTLRWTLSRAWGPGAQVCFIGHNPSTADAEKDDPTVKRWSHFARAWGYDGFIAVNLYPVRTPDAAEARRWADWEASGPDWYVRDALHNNLDNVVVPEAKRAGLVVACWGAIAADWYWIEHVLEQITEGVEPWPDVHVFGLTKDGSPIHPMARGKMRVPDHTMPTLWRQGAKP